MKKINKYLYLLLMAAIILPGVSCKKQLNVGNPNVPTENVNVTNLAGAISYAEGAVYVNGFQNGDAWLGNSYFSLPYGYNELLGDVVGSDVANQLISEINVPDYYILDNGTKITSPTTAVYTIRTNNTRSQSTNGYNPTYYQWLNMYAMNAALNSLLNDISTITSLSSDQLHTLQAWAYFWKGYAYASIGTMYYSGLIIDSANGASNHYVIKDTIINRSNYYYNLAISALNSISSGSSDYTTVLGQLIPAFCQVGHGGVLTPAMWIDNINSMLARNIIENKLATFVNSVPGSSITAGTNMTAMTTADWNNVITLCTSGIQSGDYVFTGRSTSINGFFSTAGGTISAMSVGPFSSSTFKVSERLIQDFHTGDYRFANNFAYNSQPYQNTSGFGTYWNMIDGGNDSTGVIMYGDKSDIGAYELFIGSSYEENELNLAEAYIRTGQIDKGLSYIDAVRAYQGANIAAVSGTGLTQVQALQELVMERRVALAFRGISFYDIRRWGWIYPISDGGGSYGNMLLQTNSDGTVTQNTNVTINYGFLDYWDIPADETVLNPADASSAPTSNPQSY